MMLLYFFVNFVIIIGTIVSISPYIPAFHFTPTPENWINDPNGLFYDAYTDLYHLMYQYKTPRVWGHAVSSDLFTWKNLPIALENNEPYNSGGVYTGSTTVIPSISLNKPSTLYIIYSTSTNNDMCIATPTNRTDPNVTRWTNYATNPVTKTNSKGFPPNGRDPTTAWSTDNKTYYFIYGTEKGVFTVNITNNWQTFQGMDYFYFSNTSGQWECPDFFKFPVSPNPETSYLLKGSLFAWPHGGDFFAIGGYDDKNMKFIPYNGSNIESRKQMFDYGTYYSSKSMYDGRNNRQIIIGWSHEERPEKFGYPQPYGWACVLTLFRKVELYSKNPSRIITPVVDEFNDLHINETYYIQENIIVISNTVLFFDETFVSGNQMDIIVTNIVGMNVNTECGIYVLSDGIQMEEYTKIGVNYTSDYAYFVDTNKSSLNPNCTRLITYGYLYNWSGNDLDPIDIRIIVDHSIIEVYINGGLSVMTRRVYPTLTQSVQVGLYSKNGNCSIERFESWNVYTTMWQMET
eukprot:158025_1